MEDFQLDLIIGEGPAARSGAHRSAEVTLVGATTRLGLITTPLRERFGIPGCVSTSTTRASLEEIVRRGAGVLGFDLAPDGATEIARRSRGTRASPAACCGRVARLRRRRQIRAASTPKPRRFRR